MERDLVVPGTKSTAKLQAIVHASEPRIDFTLDLDWREIGEQNAIPALRLCLPFAGATLKGVYETPFGSVERGSMGGEEVPSLRYAHLHSVPGRGGAHPDRAVYDRPRPCAGSRTLDDQVCSVLPR